MPCSKACDEHIPFGLYGTVLWTCSEDCNYLCQVRNYVKVASNGASFSIRRTHWAFHSACLAVLLPARHSTVPDSKSVRPQHEVKAQWALDGDTKERKFFGRWAFKRVWGIHEIASVVFSVGNLIENVRGGFKCRKLHKRAIATGGDSVTDRDLWRMWLWRVGRASLHCPFNCEPAHPICTRCVLQASEIVNPSPKFQTIMRPFMRAFPAFARSSST